MASSYTDMLNTAMTYQKAFNMARDDYRETRTDMAKDYMQRADAELSGYCAAMADMFGKTIEDIRTDVHDFTEAVEAREGR